MAEQEAHWYASSIQSVDPAQYPKTYYRSSAGWRLFESVIGVIFIVIGLLILAVVGIGAKMGMHNAPVAVFSTVLSLFIGGFGAFELLSARRARTILMADAIEVYSATGMRRLLRDQVAGWRSIYVYRRGNVLILEPLNHNLKNVKVPETVQKDSLFRAWLGSLPDLDIVDVQQTETEIAADASLGATPEERMSRLTSARKTAKLLAGITYGFFAASIFHPQAYAKIVFFVLALLPWIAIALQVSNPKLYSLQASKGQARARLGAPFFTPGAALALWAMTSVHLINWHPTVGLALSSAILMGGIALMYDPSFTQKRAAVIAVPLMMGMYGYGAGIIGDIATDSSTPETFHAAVMGKHVSHGKHTSWYLKLSPWGPIREADNVDVSSELYEQVAQGDTICTNLMRGSIGIEWYTVTNCN